MKLSLKSRISLNFVLLSAVLLATVDVLSYRSGSKSLEADAMSERLSKAVETEAGLDAWIAERMSDIGEISGHADVVDKTVRLIAAPPASPEARSAHAILLQELEPYVSVLGSNFTELFVMEPDSGKVVASTSPAEEAKTKLGHSYFDHGRTDLYLQPLYYSTDRADPSMTAAIPMRADDGRVVAVLAARLNLGMLDTIVQRRTGLHQTEDSYLVNDEKFAVTQPRFMTEPAVLRRKIDTAAVRLCVAHKSGVTMASDYRGVPSIYAYRWNAKNQFGLIVKIDQAEALAPARAFGWSLALISIFALLAAGFLAVLVARTITKPLNTLAARVRGFAEKDVQGPLQPFLGDEVNLLAGEFDRMAERVAERSAKLTKVNEVLKVENDVRKRSEELLATTSDLLEELLKNTTDVIYFKDSQSRFVHFSRQMLKLFHLTDPNELTGKTDFDFFADEHARTAFEAEQEIIRTGKPILDLEEKEVHRDGRVTWASTSKIAWHDKAGNVIGTMGISRDITEKKAIGENLRRTSAKLKYIMQQTPAVIYTLKVEGSKVTPTFASDNMSRLLGFVAAEAMSHNWWLRCLHPDDRERMISVLTEGLQRGGYSADYQLRRKDGAYRWVEDNNRVVCDEAGQPMEMIGLWTDITERKRLEAHRDRLVAILESTTDVVGTADPDGHCTYFNRAGRNLLGVGPEEDITKRVISEFHPAGDPILTEGISTAIRQGEWQGESFLVSRGGHNIPVSELVIAHKSPVGKVEFISAVMRDITERKKAEAEMNRLHKELVEASRLAGMAEIATNVLHNVGNVLNSVNVSTGLIVDSVKQSKVSSLAKVVALLEEHAHDLGEFLTHDPRGQHVPTILARLSDHLMAEQAKIAGELDALRRNVEHIKEIVAMQQNYATVGGVKEVIDLVSLVEDSLRLNEGSFKRHGLEVVRELASVPPMNVEKHKILQILVNLVGNAKHACDDSGRADRRLTVRVANGNGSVKISIIDNGIGIPPENLTRIFNYGFTTRKGGHGFGLHNSALAAKEMGGSLTVLSGGPGQGADFTLELPCPTLENSRE
jgi:PAS domain S-box-containing protein